MSEDHRPAWLLPALLACAAACLALRLPGLSWLPNASHDEGNWLLVAWNVHTGHPATFSPDAAFVTTLFGRLLALGFHFAPVSIAAARGTAVALFTAGLLAVGALCARLRLPRAAVTLCALLALHPWAVQWNRSVTVPYAFSFALAVLAPLAAVHAWLGAPRAPRLARVLAGQLFALGFHFTPLASLPALGTALWALAAPHRRAALRSPGTLLSALLALAHLAPIVGLASRVAALGATRPQHYFTWFSFRLRNYLRVALGGLTGESTLRDFTGTELGPSADTLASAVFLLLISASLWSLRPARRERSGAPPLAGELASLGAALLLTALVGLPVLLAPVRNWHLPLIDADRYLFVLLAPFGFLLGALAESRQRAAWLAPLALAYLALGPLRRGLWSLAWGGGPDRGVLVERGGGADRRWKTTRARRTLPELAAEDAARVSGGGPVVLVYADYRFHPLWFVTAGRGYTLASTQSGPPPSVPGAVYLFLLWDPSVFAPGVWPERDPAQNAELAALLRSPRFTEVTRVRAEPQPNGAPLFEVWSARESPAR